MSATKPRTDFAAPVVETADITCPKCGSSDIHREMMRGANINPPPATREEWAHVLALTECRACTWIWRIGDAEWVGPSVDSMYDDPKVGT